MKYNLIKLDENPMNYAKRKERLSDFESYYLKVLGNEIRKELKDSQYFWLDGAFCWYTDGNQDRVQKVFLLDSGACIFDDFTPSADGKVDYYRVSFDSNF